MEKTLKQIQHMPTCIDNIDESCFRSSHILDQVLNMIDRGDSKETIHEVVDFLNEHPIDTERTNKT